MPDKVILLNSKETINNTAKILNTDNVVYGELGVNYHKTTETISTKNDIGKIAEFIPHSIYETIIENNKSEIFHDFNEPIGKTGDFWLYKEPLILEFTTKAANEPVILPISGRVNCTVEWGDGASVEVVIRDKPTHTYVVPGTYVVSVKGKCSALSRCSDNVTKVVSWGDVSMGLKSMDSAFYNCVNLNNIPSDEYGAFKNVTDFFSTFRACSGLTNIPEGLFANCTMVTNFEQLFYNCYSLTYIPIGLFANCPLVSNFSFTFNECSGLTGSIPPGLFDSCPLVTNFKYVFYSCSGLTSIPPGLFANCPLVTNFDSSFRYCTGLTGSIPTGLFDNCTNVTSFFGTFNRCSGLIGSIPTGLFANCPLVINFGSTFRDCTGLTGSIPTGLFDNCTNVTSFSGTFSNCSGLIGSIPTELFANCTMVTNFGYTFDSCINLTGNTPTTNGLELWQRAGQPGYPSVIDGTNCFNTCNKLDNFAVIPSNWK